MLQLANLFLEIALLRRTPQEVPASGRLLRLAAAAAVLSYVLAEQVHRSVFEAVQRATFDVLVLAAFVYVVLAFLRHTPRFTQAFTALCGTGALLNLIAWPLFGVAYTGDAQSGLRGGAVLLLWALLAWSVVVTAHIFRHTFNQSMGAAVVTALGYVFLTLYLTGLVFPAAPAAS